MTTSGLSKHILRSRQDDERAGIEVLVQERAMGDPAPPRKDIPVLKISRIDSLMRSMSLRQEKICEAGSSGLKPEPCLYCEIVGSYTGLRLRNS